MAHNDAVRYNSTNYPVWSCVQNYHTHNIHVYHRYALLKSQYNKPGHTWARLHHTWGLQLTTSTLPLFKYSCGLWKSNCANFADRWHTATPTCRRNWFYLFVIYHRQLPLQAIAADTCDFSGNHELQANFTTKTGTSKCPFVMQMHVTDFCGDRLLPTCLPTSQSIQPLSPATHQPTSWMVSNIFACCIPNWSSMFTATLSWYPVMGYALI